MMEAPGGAWSTMEPFSSVTNRSAVLLNNSGTLCDNVEGLPHLLPFSEWYRQVHGYLATVVCILGIIANILNIVVLTRKNMISATNCILTGLAVSDGLTMVAYLPFALRFYVLYGIGPSAERNTKEAMRFLLFYACFSVVVHTVSIWLTVTLAIFRYIFVKHPRRGAVLCSLYRAKVAVFLVYVVTLVVCIPNFVTITVQRDKPETTNSTNNTEPEIMWYVSFKLDNKTDKFIHDFNFWIQAILVKLVPCIGLTILSMLLVQTMKRAQARRQHMKMKGKPTVSVQSSSSPCITPKSTDAPPSASSSRDRKTNRTTRMLLAVVALFLLTEFPQGILNLLSGILSCFVYDVYNPLGDFMDILALINNGINFILYCTMSKQFRDTFIEVFLSSIYSRRRFSLVPQSTSKAGV